MGYVEDFARDVSYYDPEDKEVKAIINSVNLKDKVLLDAGCGTGRLSFPLAKFAKAVYGVDSDKRMIAYCKKQQKLKNLFFINQKNESFVKKNDFDALLLAWPKWDKRLINAIKNSMRKDTLFIAIINDPSSDASKIYKKFMSKGEIKKWKKIKLEFVEYLHKEFKVLKYYKINASYLFPSKKAAIEDAEWNLITWFIRTKIDKRKRQLIEKTIEPYRKGKKYEIPERVFFLVLKLKGS